MDELVRYIQHQLEEAVANIDRTLQIVDVRVQFSEIDQSYEIFIEFASDGRSPPLAEPYYCRIRLITPFFGRFTEGMSHAQTMHELPRFVRQIYYDHVARWQERRLMMDRMARIEPPQLHGFIGGGGGHAPAEMDLRPGAVNYVLYEEGRGRFGGEDVTYTIGRGGGAGGAASSFAGGNGGNITATEVRRRQDERRAAFERAAGAIRTLSIDIGDPALSRAAARAEKLLISHLSELQKKEYNNYGIFHVTGCDTGTVYKITKESSFNIWCVHGRYCFMPDDEKAPQFGDRNLAQKIMIEKKEVHVLKTIANRQPLPHGPTPAPPWKDKR